jgi:hypothetical protein
MPPREHPGLRQRRADGRQNQTVVKVGANIYHAGGVDPLPTQPNPYVVPITTTEPP